MGTEVGSLSVSVNVSGNPKAMEKQILLNTKNALKAMADAALQRTQMLEGHGVPIKTGQLQSTGIVDSRGEFTYVAQFGNGLEYARYQEFGPDGKDYTGKKKVWDYTTPGTGNYYLKTAGDSVAKEGIKNYL